MLKTLQRGAEAHRYTCRCARTRGHEVASRLTPGYVHNIARAETYAVLQGLKMVRACTFYVDNQGVVTNLRKILDSGLNPLFWRGRPNFDLWSEIANVVVSRGPGIFNVNKVKSHQNACAAATSELAWIIRGNDKADALAKRHLQLFVQDKPELHNRGKRYDQFIQRTLLCSSMLQEVSQLVFQTRKDKEIEPEGEARAARDQQDADAVINYSAHDIPLSNIPSSCTWGARWLDVAAYYFSLIKWPESEAVARVPFQCLSSYLTA